MEVDEEEVPPLLVNQDTLTEDPEGAASVRVPITIVTGTYIPE